MIETDLHAFKSEQLTKRERARSGLRSGLLTTFPGQPTKICTEKLCEGIAASRRGIDVRAKPHKRRMVAGVDIVKENRGTYELIVDYKHSPPATPVSPTTTSHTSRGASEHSAAQSRNDLRNPSGTAASLSSRSSLDSVESLIGRRRGRRKHETRPARAPPAEPPSPGPRAAPGAPGPHSCAHAELSRCQPPSPPPTSPRREPPRTARNGSERWCTRGGLRFGRPHRWSRRQDCPGGSPRPPPTSSPR